MASEATLYVLAPSHFCERARRGLDLVGRSYVEKTWFPGLHAPLARRLAEKTSLPILVSDGAVIQGSGAILTWAGLPPEDRGVERRLETRTAPLIRRYLYSGLLHDPRSGTREMLLHGVATIQARLGALAWPLIRRAMIAGLDARPEHLPELERALERELDWLDDLIAEKVVSSRPKQFGRLHITVASLLSPLARPPQVPLYQRLHLPAEIEQVMNRWDDRPVLRWVRRAYAEHRNRG
ncbi:glutathione S-transferase N-terminal domain-containing protein [Methylobacterium sp. P31]